VTGLVLMTLFGAWAGALGAGFAAIAFVARDRLGPLRLSLYIIVAVLLLLAAVRTIYELVRRMRGL
jgi:hypothetical protein